MVNGRFLHLVVLLVNPLTPWSIHDSPLKNTELFLHWPLRLWSNLPYYPIVVVEILCFWDVGYSPLDFLKMKRRQFDDAARIMILKLNYLCSLMFVRCVVVVKLLRFYSLFTCIFIFSRFGTRERLLISAHRMFPHHTHCPGHRAIQI